MKGGRDDEYGKVLDVSKCSATDFGSLVFIEKAEESFLAWRALEWVTLHNPLYCIRAGGPTACVGQFAWWLAFLA